jgi:hypothetical protein
MRRIKHFLSLASLPEAEGDLCDFADPSAREEIRAASPIDRLEGSTVTEMVANHFRETE